MAKGSNRKNLSKQLKRPIPAEARMTLHGTRVASQSAGWCVTCHRPIEAGQRVRWCEVEGIIPAGNIHAKHFDAGPLAAKRHAADIRAMVPNLPRSRNIDGRSA